MSKPQSHVRMHMNGRLAVKRGPVRLGQDAKLTHGDLENLGVGIRAMDAALTGPAVTNGVLPGYMLQTWLPGTLRVITQIRNIDEIVGITTVGRWEDETINLRVAEPAGQAELYGDNTNIPLADYRQSIESRGIVRFEQGFQVGKLEEARQSAIGYQAADEKRKAAQESLDRSRNDVGFNGFSDSSATNVYGLLNDPSLPAYKSYADVGAGGTAWASASFDDLVKDFTILVNQIEAQMGGHMQDGTALTFVIPTGYRAMFTIRATDGSGMTFRQWLNENYPNLRVVSTPAFVGANGGKDVAYLFVENAGDADDSDVTGASIIQAVPVRYQVLGSENRIKGYIEDAINATAGVFVTRPWAFARYTISA